MGGCQANSVSVEGDTFDDSGKKGIRRQGRLEGKAALSCRQFGKQHAFVGMRRYQELS